MKEKKNAPRKESDQPNGIHSPNIKVGDFQEEKLIGDQAQLNFALTEIEKLLTENRDLKKLLQPLKEREYNFKEEICNLKTQIEEGRRCEEAMRNRLKEKNTM